MAGIIDKVQCHGHSHRMAMCDLTLGPLGKLKPEANAVTAQILSHYSQRQDVHVVERCDGVGVTG